MRLIHLMRLGAGALLVSLAGASAGAGDAIMAARAESPITVLDGAGAKAQIGKQVAVKGIARDAKISAAVVTGDLVVYCLNFANWPEGRSGKQVIAQGRIEQTNEFAAKRSPAGEISTGTDGPVWVLRDCHYQVQ